MDMAMSHSNRNERWERLVKASCASVGLFPKDDHLP